jgi:NADH-quinone oxidoreductase subunit J
MNSSTILFYIISAFILGTGILSVTTGKVFRSAIWLLFSLMGIAGLYFWMELEFIAAVQIIIYVGGIVVLIIFSIFLTQKSGEQMAKPLFKKSLFSILSVLLGFAFTYSLIYQYQFRETIEEPFVLRVSDIGTQMLSTTGKGYALPFEVISVLLLAALIGCIVIAMKVKTTEE